MIQQRDVNPATGLHHLQLLQRGEEEEEDVRGVELNRFPGNNLSETKVLLP